MRHRNSGRRFSRSTPHRQAMFRNMARALLTHEAIRTTEAKAKDLRSVVEKLITLALRDDLHSRRQAYRVLNNHQLVKRLFDEIGPRYAGGKGGYTRIIKMSLPRAGDAAPMVLIELTKRAEKVAEVKAEAAEKKVEPKAEAVETAAPEAEAKPKKAAKPKAPKAEAAGTEGEAKPKKKAAPKKKAEDKTED